MKEYLKYLMIIQKGGLIDMSGVISDNAITYSYGSYLGLLMHDRIIDNPIETRKDVDNYLFNSGLLSKDELLDKLGLSKDILMDTKVLSKRINRHTAEYKECSL